MIFVFRTLVSMMFLMIALIVVLCLSLCAVHKKSYLLICLYVFTRVKYYINFWRIGSATAFILLQFFDLFEVETFFVQKLLFFFFCHSLKLCLSFMNLLGFLWRFLERGPIETQRSTYCARKKVKIKNVTTNGYS